MPSASPLSKKNLDMVKQLEDAGVAAIVCYSLFEEQITHDANELDHYLTHGTDSFAEAQHIFPILKIIIWDPMNTCVTFRE